MNRRAEKKTASTKGLDDAFGCFLFLTVVVAFWVGWIWNIVKIFEETNDGMFLVRIIGVFFAPLGALLGFF